NRLGAFPPGPGAALSGPEHEPALVGEGGSPPCVVLHPAQQPITPLFFRAYAGSGLLIHSLARCQVCLCCCSRRRTLSMLIDVVHPSRTTAAATSYKVQRPSGAPCWA